MVALLPGDAFELALGTVGGEVEELAFAEWFGRCDLECDRGLHVS